MLLTDKSIFLYEINVILNICEIMYFVVNPEPIDGSSLNAFSVMVLMAAFPVFVTKKVPFSIFTFLLFILICPKKALKS